MLDELFEALNLIRTRHIARIPIVLVGTEFCGNTIRFDYLLSRGCISEADANLVRVVDRGGPAKRDSFRGADKWSSAS